MRDLSERIEKACFEINLKTLNESKTKKREVLTRVCNKHGLKVNHIKKVLGWKNTASETNKTT